jgi:hypothetical protein
MKMSLQNYISLKGNSTMESISMIEFSTRRNYLFTLKYFNYFNSYRGVCIPHKEELQLVTIMQALAQ